MEVPLAGILEKKLEMQSYLSLLERESHRMKLFETLKASNFVFSYQMSLWTCDVGVDGVGDFFKWKHKQEAIAPCIIKLKGINFH